MKDTYYIFSKIFTIAQKWQSIVDSELDSRTGISTKQWMLMVVLSRIFGDHLPTLSEAASAIGTSRQNIKRIASDLMIKGYLAIIQDPHDKRIQRLVLTRKHTEVFEGEEDLKWQEEFIKNLFTGLDSIEQARLSKSLYKLVKRIETIENNK